MATKFTCQTALLRTDRITLPSFFAGTPESSLDSRRRGRQIRDREPDMAKLMAYLANHLNAARVVQRCRAAAPASLAQTSFRRACIPIRERGDESRWPGTLEPERAVAGQR